MKHQATGEDRGAIPTSASGRKRLAIRMDRYGKLAFVTFTTFALAGLPQAYAQDVVVPEATPVAAPVDEGLLSAEEVDTLIAPVALYPDTLLTQIMFASTSPLDVVKAGRFIDSEADMTDKDRAAAVSKTSWDPSVQALAAGFPDLITRMNDHIDWTEQVGEAVMGQTDDVLASVLRLRTQAADTGYLTTNDAQTVTVNTDNTITIAPTNPQIVYVPTYDAQKVYTTPAPTTEVVYINEGNNNNYSGNLLTSGLIVFGTAMVLDEIFDRDDPWDDYWRGPPAINWDGGRFDRGPNYNFGGGNNINIDVGNNNIGNGFGNGNNTFNRPNRPNRPGINNRPNRPGINNDLLQVDRDRVGSLRDKGFRPSDDQRANAQAKLKDRKASGDRLAKLPPTRDIKAGGVGAAVQKRPSKLNKPVSIDRASTLAKPAKIKQPRNLSAPQNKVQRKAKPAMQPRQTNVFNKSGGPKAKAASQRGKASMKRRK